MALTILKRVGTYALVLFGLSVLIFIIVRVMPGDTARMALGARTPEETVQALRVEMHLDKPLPTQYYYWITSMLKGDFGTSVVSKRPVLDDIKSYLPATIELAVLTASLLIVGGLLLGVVSTKYSGKWPDAIIRILSYFGVVVPAFLWAVLAMLTFAYLWPIFPAAGRISPGLTAPPYGSGMYILDYLLAGNLQGAADAFRHLILPAVVLCLGGVSQAARITRSSMIDNMEKPYASALRAYGIPENKILFKYLLKPSLNSTVSVMAMDIAGIFGGAYIIENVFNYPGLGRYTMQAMLNKDVFAVSAVILVQGTIIAVFNLATDILISFLDPRIRYAKTA